MAKPGKPRAGSFSHNMVNGQSGLNVGRRPGGAFLVEDLANRFNMCCYFIERYALLKKRRDHDFVRGVQDVRHGAAGGERGHRHPQGGKAIEIRLFES